MDKFFIKYPSIVYDNTLCTDITRRVKITNQLRVPNLFYPLELNSGLRSDLLADAYYEDPDMDWLILMANDIVDPYYQWYLDEVDFDAYIEEKYGSIEYALEHIKCYRNNWYSDDTELTPSYYDNHLTYEMKKYYSPVYGQSNKIISYARKKVDWVTNTNKILQYELSSITGNGFSIGEIVDIKYANTVTNIVSYSQEFAQWDTPLHVTVVDNAVVAPDGTTTAATVTETAANNYHSIITGYDYPIRLTSGASYAVSVYIKPINNSSRRIALWWADRPAWTSYVGVFYNCDTGAVTSYSEGGAVISNTQAEEANNGFIRLSMVANIGDFTLAELDISNEQISVFGQYTGNTSKSFAVWGVQAQLNTLSDYIPTTATTASDIVVGETVGGGEVVTANDTVLFIQHVSGNSHANSTWNKAFVGETSNTEAVCNTEVIISHENITNAEADFWSSVSYYDYEQEQNESRKHMKVIDSNHAIDISENFRKKLKE